MKSLCCPATFTLFCYVFPIVLTIAGIGLDRISVCPIDVLYDDDDWAMLYFKWNKVQKGRYDISYIDGADTDFSGSNFTLNYYNETTRQKRLEADNLNLTTFSEASYSALSKHGYNVNNLIIAGRIWVCTIILELIYSVIIIAGVPITLTCIKHSKVRFMSIICILSWIIVILGLIGPISWASKTKSTPLCSTSLSTSIVLILVGTGFYAFLAAGMTALTFRVKKEIQEEERQNKRINKLVIS